MLQGALRLGGLTFPRTALFIIGVAGLLTVLLWLLLNRTSLGKQVNAASSDMEMAEALGLNVPLLFTSVFALGSALAGGAGTLLALRLSFLPALGVEFLIYAFAVVIIGGLGSFKGSVYGSLIVGICYSVGTFYISEFAMVFVFALLLLTLLIRPAACAGGWRRAGPRPGSRPGRRPETGRWPASPPAPGAGSWPGWRWRRWSACPGWWAASGSSSPPS